MNKKSGTSKDAADKLVRGIKRKTGKHYCAEEKIRIVLVGLRGEESIAALADRSPRPRSVWNRIPDQVRNDVVDFALDHEDLTPRELTVKYTDEKRSFVSKSSVYRILSAEDLISEVFRYNIPKGLISANFAKDVIPTRRPRDRADANRPWTIEERDTILGRAKPHVRVALALVMNTGLDPSDALRLRNDQVDGGTIWGVRGKTSEEVAIPVSPTLKAALDRMPKHEAETVLSNSRGEAWTYNGFLTVWHRFKTALENEGLIEKGLTLKGLRHTVATTLREAGLDERRIADLLGQKTPSMARHYSRSANLAYKNRETIATLEEENRRRAESVKPSQKSVKPDQNEDQP